MDSGLGGCSSTTSCSPVLLRSVDGDMKPQKNDETADKNQINIVIRVDINLELQDSMLDSASTIRREKNIQMLYTLSETLNICKQLLNMFYQKILKISTLFVKPLRMLRGLPHSSEIELRRISPSMQACNRWKCLSYFSCFPGSMHTSVSKEDSHERHFELN